MTEAGVDCRADEERCPPSTQSALRAQSAHHITRLPQGQYWAGRTPRPNNGTPNMAAANFVVITNGEGCALNRTAVATVLINQSCYVLSFGELRLVVDCR